MSGKSRMTGNVTKDANYSRRSASRGSSHPQETTRKTGKAVETLHEILRSDQLLALALFIATTLADILMLHQHSALARRNPVQAVRILPVNQISVIDL